MVMLNPYLQNNQFCADNNVKADEGTCNGDSGTLSFYTFSSFAKPGGPGFTRDFKDGKNYFTMLGVVSGSLNSLRCGGELPDYYTYIGNQEVLKWIGKSYEASKIPFAKFNHINNIEDFIRCEDEEDCPRGNYCIEGFCYRRSTQSSSTRTMIPDRTCPEATPCRGRAGKKCVPAKCNRYGDSCWCGETRRRQGRTAFDNVQDIEPRKGKEFDFVDGKPEEWEIACDTKDDCPHQWYCAREVCYKSICLIFLHISFLTLYFFKLCVPPTTFPISAWRSLSVPHTSGIG